MSAAADYRVHLDVFNGPLDLLLFLVRQQEVDILDIPLATVTQQYLQYLDALSSIDLDRVGDFLVMASTLIEIKSRMVLPRPAADATGEEDPRQDLVRQLLEYKRFKEASARLQELAEQWQQHYPRRPEASQQPDEQPSSQPAPELELWDLVSAYERMMRETLAAAPASIVYDDTPIEVYMQRIEERLASQRRLAFHELFDRSAPRSQIVGTFLALLELVRSRRVRVEQDGDFGKIWISAASETSTP